MLMSYLCSTAHAGGHSAVASEFASDVLGCRFRGQYGQASDALIRTFCPYHNFYNFELFPKWQFLYFLYFTHKSKSRLSNNICVLYICAQVV